MVDLIQKVKTESMQVKVAAAIGLLLSLSLMTTVAGTNLAVLGLVMVSPFAWRDFLGKGRLTTEEKIFLSLLVCICAWDIFTNLYAGHTLGESLGAALHDMRTFGFIVLLWPIFSNVHISRLVLMSVIASVVLLAGVNLLLTLAGVLPQGKYFWASAPNMYGQVLVGLFFVLAQMWLVQPTRGWRVAAPMMLLILSLFLASERRTGYVLLIVGLVIWIGLNHARLLTSKYKWWAIIGFLLACGAAFFSDVVQRRMTQGLIEMTQYLHMTLQERASTNTSLGIRMQFYTSIAILIEQSNWLIGVGSLEFSNAFYAINEKLGTTAEQAATQFSNFRNPHNEYLFMLATKGLIGLLLYLSIFAQACRLALRKKDEVQRVGMLMMVFLFMLSITTNSMMTDMQEGHFAMLMLLVFLAPKRLTET